MQAFPVLSPPAHGVFDYALLTFLAAGPTLYDFTGLTAAICYGLALAYLLITLATNFPMGLLRLIPYTIHGGMELVSALLFLGSPFLFQFSSSQPLARNFFMAFGAALLLLWALTGWTSRVPSDMTDNPHSNLEGKPDPV